MRSIAPVILAVLAVAAACSRGGPYCYEWNAAYSRGDAAETAAAHREWILAHLPQDIAALLKGPNDIIDRPMLQQLEHLVMVNCELHLTLPVTTVLGDLVDNYRVGNIKIFEQ